MIPELTAEQYEELQAKFGELYEADTSLGKVYVRRATKHEFRRCVKKVREEKLDAQDELCVACAAYPPPEAMGQLFDRYPALSITIAEVITNVAMGDEESSAKKPFASGNRGEMTSSSPQET